MRQQICKLNYQKKFWSVLSGAVCYSVQLPSCGASCSDQKKIPVEMKECNSNLWWLSEECPEFPVPSKNIKVLKEPSEFFEKLKDLAKHSKKRITLASLYIGTGPLEKELVSSIETGLENSKGLQVSILVDYTRGSRGKENTRTLLLPLLKDYHSQMQVSLYHTPKLRGFIKWFLPERWNETIGLSHLKVYLFDDTLLLSGANLSDQYFTNRQDRYIIFNDCKDLCNYFDRLVSTVSSFSFHLNPDDSVALNPKWNIHPSEGNFKNFIAKANHQLKNFMQTSKEDSKSNKVKSHSDGAAPDTFVYPLLQMYTFGIRKDEKITEQFLCSAEKNSCIKLASGYFNLTNHYMNIILKSSKAFFSLLVASPKVNGFFGASGVSGAIPMAYTHIAKTFFAKVLSQRQENRIQLHEYERPGWTFHVKGLWYYKPDEILPSVTFIGSPNFGYRSVYKDLEAQVAIVTQNEELQMQLHEEQQRLYDRTSLITKTLFERPDRKVSLWVKLVTFFIRDFF